MSSPSVIFDVFTSVLSEDVVVFIIDCKFPIRMRVAYFYPDMSLSEEYFYLNAY